MYATRNTTDPEAMLAGIAGGPLGLIADDSAPFILAGGAIRPSASGRIEWAVLPDGRAFPVTCGDVVERRYPEGETYTDRCGRIADGRGACEGHGEARDAYRAMTEAERAAMERREAEDALYA